MECKRQCTFLVAKILVAPLNVCIYDVRSNMGTPHRVMVKIKSVKQIQKTFWYVWQKQDEYKSGISLA